MLPKPIPPLRRLRFLLGAFSLGVGLAYGWFGRAAFHDIDGISYMDMGDAYLRGDWTTAINGLWSPLYGVLVSAVIKIAHPSPTSEFLVVHLVSLVIFVAAMVSFDFLWREFAQILFERTDSHEGRWVTFPLWTWYVLGYSLFLWVSLQLIEVLRETPDMLLSAAVYLASALSLRISRDQEKLWTFVLLGAVLGLGYLTKAILFPLSFVFLGVAAFTTFKKKHSLMGPAVATIVFLLASSPLILALSHAKGRLTFGDSGKINYLWHVDGVRWIWWLSDFPNSGSAIHPPRKLLDKPSIYEFAGPFVATFPPWYDPSYWYDGINPHFDLRKQVRAFREGVGIYRGLFLKPGALLIAACVLFYWMGSSARELTGRLDVLLPVIAALVLYAMVHVEPRYVGCFLLIFWGGVLSQIRLSKSEFATRLLKFSALAIVLLYSVELCFGALSAARDERNLSRNIQVEVEAAEGLVQAGLKPHDRVAVIGGISGMVWARLDKLHVVASSSEGSDSWMQDAGVRSRALSAFAATGAKAILAERTHPPDAPDGWKRIGQTPYYLYALVPLGSQVR